MVLTPSTMLELGTPLPDFSLPDVVSGSRISPATFKGRKAFLVMFVCQHCPYVQHIKEEMARLGQDYKSRDIAIVAISSNDAKEYPDDSPENLKKFAQEQKFIFPFCYDETQKVAKDFTAACTPDFFLFDGKRKLVYRGQLDDSRPGNGKPVTGKDLRAAIEEVLSDRAVPGNQKASLGCNIKWKSGQEPIYFQAKPKPKDNF